MKGLNPPRDDPVQLEERLGCLAEELVNLRRLVSLLLQRLQPSQPATLQCTPPGTPSQQPSRAFAAPEWAFQIKAAFERISREIAVLKEMAKVASSGPDQTKPHTLTRQPEPNTNGKGDSTERHSGKEAQLSFSEPSIEPSSEPSSAADGDTEWSATHQTNYTEAIDEEITARPKLSRFHLAQQDMGRNLVENIVRCREDPLFAGKLTVEVPPVSWSQVLESLASITGDDYQLGVEFRANKKFTNLWVATLSPSFLCRIPPPPQSDTKYRQGLEVFLNNLIEDPPKKLIPYYVGPTPLYDGLLSAGVDLEKLPRTSGVNSHYLHLGDENSGTAFHREDGSLRSCNLTLYGIKVWMLIHTDDNDKFEKLARLQGTAGSCAQYIRHLSIIISPKVLRNHGIRFDICCTGPGEMILTDPGQYHAVINRTSCLALSINLSLPGEELGIDGLAVCSKCGLHSFRAPGVKLLKVNDPPAAVNETLHSQRSMVPQKRMAEDHERPVRHGTRPDRSISMAIAALKHEEREALKKDKQCSIPKYDVDSPPPSNVLRLALVLRSRDSVRQLCGLVKQRRALNIQRPQERRSDTHGTCDEDVMMKKLCDSAKLLGQEISTGNMGVLKRRLAQINYHHIAELARGDRQRISPATSQRIREVSGLTKDTLKHHMHQGRRWAALCDPLPGLLCLIPLYRHSTGEQSDVTSSDYTSLSITEQEILRKLLDDDYGRVLCGAAAAFLGSVKGDGPDVEFMWENYRDVCMDTCDEKDMLRLVQVMPYRDENVWDPGKCPDWTRPKWWPEPWSWPADPTSKPPELDHPSYCEGKNCDCLGKLAVSTPLIRSYGNKGRGLQAVASRPGTVAYKKGEVLGVLTGEIHPPGTYRDDPWTLDFVRSDLPDEPVVCQIRSANVGSRFRLLNTGLNPCARLQSKRRWDRYVTAVVAVRDIMDGEEIVISYGQSRAVMEAAGFVL